MAERARLVLDRAVRCPGTAAQMRISPSRIGFVAFLGVSCKGLGVTQTV
jgi:hypothetical protein